MQDRTNLTGRALAFAGIAIVLGAAVYLALFGGLGRALGLGVHGTAMAVVLVDVAICLPVASRLARRWAPGEATRR